jgi:hypothetical protein
MSIYEGKKNYPELIIPEDRRHLQRLHTPG